MNGGREWLTGALLAAATTLLHLSTATDGYGVFRDELYYVACSRNLDFGYVDQPPLVALVTRFGTLLFGSSQLGLRVLPALAGGAAVFLATRMTRELGGDRFAGVLAALATALAPVFVANFGYLSMNAYDVALWAACLVVVLRCLRTGTTRGWLLFGVIAGLGLQNKISMLFLGFGLVGGLLAARRWDQLRSRHFWLGGLIAAAIFAPHVIWQVAHDWPTLEFIDRATRFKNTPLAPIEFLAAQVPMMNPLAVPLALVGLGYYLFAKGGERFRTLGWAFIVVVVVMITQRSKAYYLSPSYTMLFASGSVWLSSVAVGRARSQIRPLAAAVLVLSGLVLAPLAKPVLPVERYVAYAAMLGVAPSTSERKELGRLPQSFADRLGWHELAESVARVYRSLPEADRARACVFGQNYGHAGAIDYYADELGLPTALSGHNSYHLWGPRDCTGDVLIVIDDDRESLERLFEEVEFGETYTCEDCMPYEREKEIWIARRVRFPLEQVWPEIGHYD